MMAIKKTIETSGSQDLSESQQSSVIATDMSVSGLPETVATQSGRAPLGELLLAARNAKKLTQKDVSNSLRISIKQITALETDDFAVLPEAMITRGFIRNYARLLEIDAEPLLVSYRAQIPDKMPTALSVNSSMNQVMSGKDSQPWLMYILSSILVLLFLLAWLFYVDYMPKPVPEIKPQSIALESSSAAVALPEIALPAAERQAEGSLDATGVVANSDLAPTANATTLNTGITNHVDENASSVVTGTSNFTTFSNPAASTITPLSATPSSVAPSSNAVQTNKGIPTSPTLPLVVEKKLGSAVTPAGQVATSSTVDFSTFKKNAAQVATANQNIGTKTAETTKATETNIAEIKASDTKAVAMLNPVNSTKKVKVSVDEQAWIRVSDKSGKVVFEKLLEAGAVEGFDGEPPLNVLVGNAKATKLTFLGKPLDLTSYTKDNVARLVLQ